MKKAYRYVMVCTFLMIFHLFVIQAAVADDQDLFTQGSSYIPNVLIILDNSQSMDQDFSSNAVAPYNTGSRMVEAKRALQQVINTYANQMRIGLMTYKLDSVSAWHVHNIGYFTSYDSKSYCPSTDTAVLAACKDYCETGNETSRDTCQAGCRTAAGTTDFDATYLDEIITQYSTGSEQRNRYCNLVYPKTQRTTNLTDTGNYVYYKMPAAYYNSGDDGTAFCYSRTYNASETGSDSYRCFDVKTGTSDGTYVSPNPGQYSGSYADYTFAPTDDDIALGYRDFGRRNAWYHTGQSWFVDKSPGGGYLQVECDTNPANNTHLNSLLAKLDMKEGDAAGYMNSALCSGSKSNTCPHVISSGLTPMAGTLQTAIDYFKGADTPIQDSCQKNFVIFVTDGLPSVGTSGTKGTAADLMPGVLAKVDSLRALVKTITVGGEDIDYTFNILTYVIGVAITPDAQNYLDTMASRGGTAVDGKALYADNTAAIVSSLNAILSDITTRSYSFATASISSSRTADENYIYEATFEPVGSDYPFWKGYLKKWTLKTDGTLDYVVWDAGAKLSNNMSASSRTMKTLIGGSLVGFKYSNQDVSEPTPVAYTKMGVADQATADKIIKYIRGYATDPDNAAIVTNPDNWKLGDIFHSSPITLGTPSPFFNDTMETNPNVDPDDSSIKTKAFDVYKRKHIRASHCSDNGTTCEGYGKRMIVVGANDGQYHAFNAATGYEFWSFVPPNLLPKLQYLAHYTTSDATGHHFFVDGRTTAADAWLPASVSDGTQKSYLDWKTLVMFALGRNDRDYTTADKSSVPQTTKLWSSSASCDSGLAEYYDATTAPYYCGYYAFDFTEGPTTLPSFKWTLQPDYAGVTAGPYLGEPWSAVSIGRVKIAGNERWIGVIGGGYNAAECSTTTCADKRGKGIIVFDLRDGKVLWSYNWGTTNTNTTSIDMGFAIPAQVALVDGDYDGFLDHGYVGDIKGNVWQIKFCSKADYASDASCGTSAWKGSLLLDKLGGTDKYPIYTQATVTRDSNNDTWIFWSSGDMVDPTGNGPAAYVYGLKPLYCKDVSGNPTPCLRSDLDNITSDKNTYCEKTTTKWGWYINLAGKNEQVLSQPVAFNNILYFTSFIPASGSSASCTKTGTSQLYGISIDTSAAYCNVGAGIFSSGARFVTVGAGIASGVLLSYNPDGTMNAYVTVSGAGGQEGSTLKAPFTPPAVLNRSNLLYWKDRRVQ